MKIFQKAEGRSEQLAGSHARSMERAMQITLAVALFGFAHWFFGNLYEQIVITPNLGLGEVGLRHYRQFFVTTDPVYYFVPISWFGLLGTLAALWIDRHGPPERRRWLVRAALWGIAVGILTFFIVTQNNLRVFFGPMPASDAIYSIRLLSVILSAVRLICEALVLVYLVRACVLTSRLGLILPPGNELASRKHLSAERSKK